MVLTGSGGGKAGAGGGAAGTSGGGAGGAACVPTGAEDCFNGKDDDCDGKIDCADPDCAPTAQCVTADPTAAPIGLLTGTGPCPTAGYGNATKVMSGDNPLSCTGCGCKAPTAVTCTTTLTSYNATALCEADSTVVEKAGTFSTGDDKSCTVIPPWSINPSGDIFGIVTTKFTAAVATGCTATGTPVVPTLTWTSNGTFCATASIGGGCGAGQVCVPITGGGSPCQLFDGNKTSCPGGAQPLPWYTGTSGTASCGACSCGAATGAGCDNVTLSVGSDYGCSGSGSISSGGSLCFAAGIYEPGVQFSGTPTAPTCQASSPYTGNPGPRRPTRPSAAHDPLASGAEGLRPSEPIAGEAGPSRGPKLNQMCTTSPKAAAVASYITSESVGWGWTAASTSWAVASEVMASDISAMRSVTP